VIYIEPINLLSVINRDELRVWLEKYHQAEKECWVIVKRGRPKDDGTFWYIDAVEEAMCFGWIDSTTKTLLYLLWLRGRRERGAVLSPCSCSRM